ncbi:PCDBD protein, partial [Brachypodius atriceps]|nr:PCDBD protein [Brachypodius atriceps]
ILEMSETGSRFPLEVAQDLDIGSNSIQAYSISPKNEYFSVSYGTRLTGKKYLELVLEKALDREEQSEMAFSVIAEDGGSHPRSGTTQVQIVILDVNDNAPIFKQEVYVAKVLENMPEGSVVLSVLATDQDAGVNGEISYHLSQVVGQSDSAFVVDPKTGEIKLTKPLDFEAAQIHELSVRVRDGGGLSAICKVVVTLEDINDHSPVFPEERVNFKILETSDSGLRFPLEEAHDLDIGSNSIQAYSISPKNEYFSVSYGTQLTGKKYLELVVEKPLDREEQSEMSFSVIAEDGGSPPKSGSTEINVVILDVNDNVPIF